MKTPSSIGRPGAFRAAALAGGSTFALDFADLALVCGGLRCDRFDESAALPAKVREHRSHDGLHFDAETARTLPFGCEYAITRAVDLYDGGARLTVDVRPANGGVLRHLELDPVTVTGAIARFGWQSGGEAVAWRPLPESPETTVLEAPFAPAVLAVESASGTVLEIGCGDDLWRHRPAFALNTPRCTLTAGPEGLRLRRTILDFSDEAAVERRPWRWEYYLAWSLPADAADAAAGDDRSWQNGLPETARRLDAASHRVGWCATSAPLRRRLRDRIRAARADLRFTDLDAAPCADAAHTGRAAGRELLHGNAAELLALHQWGNRQLAARGFAFRMRLAVADAAAHPALAGALDRVPRPLTGPEEA